jgi:RNA polymerase sigma factor (TIGR02999 family)
MSTRWRTPRGSGRESKDHAGRVTATPEVAALAAEVYTELRRIAGRYVRRERAKSVQATDLVHEAYLRLLKDKNAAFTDRTHFMAIAAIAMRRLLVERARARGASKRGGGQVRVTLDDAVFGGRSEETSAVDLVALDVALERLAEVDPEQAKIVELRYFGGLSVDETAEAMSLSPATIKRHWTIARAFLKRALS